MGGGRHYFPWIGHDDVVYALHHLLHDDTLSGPVNLVAPEATRQGELATALGRAVGMPAFTPLPAFAIKLGFGQMGEEMLLAGQHARPTRLSGRFVFSTPTLKEALEAELGP